MICNLKKYQNILFLTALIIGVSSVSAPVQAETINLSQSKPTSTSFMSSGKASWYAYKGGLFAASPDFPAGTKLKVTSVSNPSKSVIVTVNDYGPDRKVHPERVIDLDKVAFIQLAPTGAGVIDVSVEPIDLLTNLPLSGGELWQDNKTGGIYWVTPSGKQPLSDRVFLKTIFKDKKINSKKPSDLAKLKTLPAVTFPDGYLLKSTSNPTVYLISSNERKAFQSGAVFEKLGYTWKNIVIVSDKLINKYPKGTILGNAEANITEPIKEPIKESIKTRDEKISLTSKSAIVLNAVNGEIIYSKNAEAQMPLASLSKLVAMKVFLDTKPDLNKVVTYKVQDENYNYEYADKSVLARLRVNDGETMTIRDLLYSSILGSSNNAVESLVRVSGLSRPDFIAKMNKYVKEVGASQTKFVEPTGLSPDNLTSAIDYALISRSVLKDGHLEKVSMTKEYSFNTINTKKPHYLKNTNSLFFTSNLKITGSKTGYLDEALYCLMTRAKDNNGHEVIAITLGTPKKASSFQETEKLINYGLKSGI